MFIAISVSQSPSSTSHQRRKDAQADLSRIARALVAPGKGILALDQSPSIVNRRFLEAGIENTEENRRLFRQLLFTTDHSLSENISGISLPDEALYQLTNDCTPFVNVIKERGILVGVRVDKGTVTLSGTACESITEGLDGLAERCTQYKKDGCDFATYRCVVRIGRCTPSHLAIAENANVLARFASICQEHKMVPILRPEVLTDGDHTVERAQVVTEAVLGALFKELHEYRVHLEAILLKVSLIVRGINSCRKYTQEQIALATVEALRRTVPPAVPGITFLETGESEEDATVILNAINSVQLTRPWALTFSFGRAILGSVLRAWMGDAQNVKRAQDELLKRAKANGLASLGSYERGSIPVFYELERHLLIHAFKY